MRLQAGLAGLLVLLNCAPAIATSARHARSLGRRQSTPAADACAVAASASSAAAAAATAGVTIPAEVAYNCLQTIPNKEFPALSLLSALQPYLEFQSDKGTYLLNPPTGYLFPGVDIDAYVATIKDNIQSGNYDSEYDFQVDLQAMLIDAKDSHLSFNGDATGLFVFQRPITLASVSVDGIQQPQVYVTSDLVQPNSDNTEYVPVTAYSPSVVKQIDGIDALEFLFAQSLVGISQDPDSLYNQNFFQLAKIIPGVNIISFFEYPEFYPGPTTNITFANGTTHQYPNVALVEADLTGITDGEDMYKQFCTPSPLSSTTSAKHKREASKLQARQGGTLPYYPKPVIAHSANAVSGYYLDQAGLEDVAVLAIYTFEPENPNEDFGGELEFQQVVQTFLAEAVKAGKRKLVIDLQTNAGGLVDLGLDTFAQLFPTFKPNVKSNMRASVGMDLLSQAASFQLTQDEGNTTISESVDEVIELNYTPFAFQSVMTPDAQEFPTFNSFYGPQYLSDGYFTQFFQNNYTNTFASDPFGEGITITGNGNRTSFTQPFAPHDIILLTDGFCASTCATFAEFMKSYGHVQSITIGGRPQTGPMQAVGGVKGTQIFSLQSFPAWIQLFNSNEDKLLSQAQGTVFENFTDLPIRRAVQDNPGGVNGRNSFRVGDNTNTPLQYVYEAADCRMWWTQEMLYDPTFLWNRVAEMAFQNRISANFSSKYCITDSTGQPTSIGGGWEQGTLGPQTPPANAKPSTTGWLVDGDVIGSTTGPADEHNPVSVAAPQSTSSSTVGGTTGVQKSQAITDACNGYTGDLWMVKLVCGALSY